MKSSQVFAAMPESELRRLYGSFHNDFHGCRPINTFKLSREQLLVALDQLDEAVDALKATPEGRAILVKKGYLVEEEA